MSQNLICKPQVIHRGTPGIISIKVSSKTVIQTLQKYLLLQIPPAYSWCCRNVVNEWSQVVLDESWSGHPKEIRVDVYCLGIGIHLKIVPDLDINFMDYINYFGTL